MNAHVPRYLLCGAIAAMAAIVPRALGAQASVHIESRITGSESIISSQSASVSTGGQTVRGGESVQTGDSSASVEVRTSISPDSSYSSVVTIETATSTTVVRESRALGEAPVRTRTVTPKAPAARAAGGGPAAGAHSSPSVPGRSGARGEASVRISSGATGTLASLPPPSGIKPPSPSTAWLSAPLQRIVDVLFPLFDRLFSFMWQ